MSGFVGVRNREAPVTDELLDRLWDPISHRGPDATGRWCDGPMGVAAGVLRVSPESSDEEQPFRHRSGVMAVFDGRLDNRPELLSTLPSNDLTSRDADVVLVAEAYIAWGDRFPERLNGEYALAVLDPKSRRVLLARDVVGTRSVAFSETGGGDVVFASEAKALFAHPSIGSEPNLDVVAEYLLGGNARATPWDSLFTRVRRVPPGVTVLVGEGGVAWRTHDEFDHQARTSRRSYGEYVEEYRELFIGAVGRRVRSHRPVGVFVSGGVDSSSILSVAASRVSGGGEIIPVHISFPGSPADEETYVKELEVALGLAIERVVARPDDLMAATAEQALVLEAPVSSSGWESRVAAWRLLREMGVKAYLGGHWGDQVLVDQSYLVGLFDRLHWTEVRRHLAEYPMWMQGVPESFFRRTFVEDLIRWHLPRSAANVLRVLRSRLQGAHHDAAWYTEELRGRATAPPLRPLIGGWSSSPTRSRVLDGRLWGGLTAGLSISWNGVAASNYGLAAQAPFLDRDLLGYLMSVPGEVVTPSGRVKGLHRDAMIGILPEAIRDRRDKGDGTSLSNTETSQAIPSIVELFDTHSVSGTMRLVDPNVISADAGRLKQRLSTAEDFEVGELVTRVVALELWLRSF